jgi:hypothetical protein
MSARSMTLGHVARFLSLDMQCNVQKLASMIGRQLITHHLSHIAQGIEGKEWLMMKSLPKTDDNSF